MNVIVAVIVLLNCLVTESFREYDGAMKIPWYLICLMVWGAVVNALENGLARTPPMGWLSWERFRCITDCVKYPRDCISENLVKRTVDAMVRDGYQAAGYEYVGVDDCWLEKDRDEAGRMVPDRQRFPNGMKAVADYVHSKGFKFAMYQDYGSETCAGYPGLLGHELIDAQTFAEWEIDYLKVDGCKIDPKLMDLGYPSFGSLLNATGRPIVYSCSWPYYQEEKLMLPNYTSIAEHCNLWRSYEDIEDSYNSVTDIMSWYAKNQERLTRHAGPGHWNDPDMLIIGNFGLSLEQSRVQMAVWAVLAAPLLISADLDTMRPEYREILLNKRIIAVDQDPLGKQGQRILQITGRDKLDVWSRDLSDGANAIAFVSNRIQGTPYISTVTLAQLQLNPNKTYFAEDLYEDVPDIEVKNQFEVKVNPTGVKFYKFKPQS